MDRRLGALLTGIVTARLLVACGGSSVPGGGSDLEPDEAGGSGTGGSPTGGSDGNVTGGSRAAGGTGGVGVITLGGSGVGGSVVGSTGGFGGSGALAGAGALGGGGLGDEPVAAVGCGGDTFLPEFAHGLELPVPVDYLAVYRHGVTMPEDSIGTQCDGAGDRAACEMAYAAAVAGYSTALLPRPLALPYNSGVFAYVVFTRGADVELVADNAALVPLLGEIDTPNEALLSFYVNGFAGNCNQLYEYDGGYYMMVNTAPSGCGPGHRYHRVQVTTQGAVSATGIGMVPGCVGRRPRGFKLSSRVQEAPATGRYYARIAELEAAAVVAFDFMLAELTEAGAPGALLRRVKDAGRDEVRHAQVMAALASRYGAEATAPRVAPRRTPTLLEMALENVTEGCVRETWGALSARYQSQAAAGVADRLSWSAVADDEARHAELSWDLHAWLITQLSHAEQLQVEAAQLSAWEALLLELDTEPDPEVQRLAGVPSRSAALELVRDLAVQLKEWRRAQLAA